MCNIDRHLFMHQFLWFAFELQNCLIERQILTWLICWIHQKRTIVIPLSFNICLWRKKLIKVRFTYLCCLWNRIRVKYAAIILEESLCKSSRNRQLPNKKVNIKANKKVIRSSVYKDNNVNGYWYLGKCIIKGSVYLP